MQKYHGDFLPRAELERLGVECGGEDILIHVSAVLVYAEKIRIGNHVRIDPFCVLSAGGGITLGQHVHLAAHCTLIGGGGISVGDFAGVSHGAKLLSASDDFSGRYLSGPTVFDDFRGVTQAPIHVGRHAVIGAGSVLLPGVTLGDGAIVGALSLAREDVPPWTIWGGLPARQIGERRKDLLEFEKAQRERSANARTPTG